MDTEKKYVVVGRARASAVFKENDCYSLNYQVSGRPQARMIFRTRYVDKKLNAPIPEDLWVEIHCSAGSIKSAMEIYGNAAREIATILGFVSNAYVDDIEVELVYEVTEDSSEREFFQAFLPEEPIIVVPGRLIPVGVVRSLIGSLADRPDRDRILRGMVHYQHALQEWTLGSEVAALSQLFIAVENLKVASLRKYLADRNITDADLASEWGFDAGRTMKMAPYLEQQARVRLVFHGDAECHKQAKWVSDRLEHGLVNSGPLWTDARAVLVKTAEHIRKAIVEVSNIPDDAKAIMQGAPYSRPRGPLKLVKYLRGYLLGAPKDFAKPSQHYPLFVWKSKIDHVEVDGSGQYGFKFAETFTSQFGEGVSFKAAKCEVWDGSVLKDVPASDLQVGSE